VKRTNQLSAEAVEMTAPPAVLHAPTIAPSQTKARYATSRLRGIPLTSDLRERSREGAFDQPSTRAEIDPCIVEIKIAGCGIAAWEGVLGTDGKRIEQGCWMQDVYCGRLRGVCGWLWQQGVSTGIEQRDREEREKAKQVSHSHGVNWEG
jgi:hypothetical protein